MWCACVVGVEVGGWGWKWAVGVTCTVSYMGEATKKGTLPTFTRVHEPVRVQRPPGTLSVSRPICSCTNEQRSSEHVGASSWHRALSSTCIVYLQHSMHYRGALVPVRPKKLHLSRQLTRPSASRRRVGIIVVANRRARLAAAVRARPPRPPTWPVEGVPLSLADPHR